MRLRLMFALSATLCQVIALPVPASARPAVVPVAQTPAFVDDPSGTPADADADDPAIWVHPSDPGAGVVLGTLKEGGLAAFDLDGALLRHLAAPKHGRFNNVDVLGDLAAVSDRGLDRVRFYRIDPRGAAAGDDVLREVTGAGAARVFPGAALGEQRTAYGLAFGRDRSGAPVLAVSRRHETEIALLRPRGKEGVTAEHIATIALPSTFALPDGTRWSPCGEPGERPQVEGMALDSANQVLFAAQEDVGIWRVPLRDNGFGKPELIDRVRGFGVPASYDPETGECAPSGPDPGFGGRHLSADAEGLALSGDGRLIASSQGDSTFVVYERTGANRVLGTFAVKAGNGNDSVEHCDGAAVTTAALGPKFPNGLLVAHDGERRPRVNDPAGNPLPTTGFALIRWDDVRRALR
ncbi:phytase [Allokutzneria oryzae]|uniref:Phytase n=1 Tax=Allokutzneria oryzae TaxID=1378989 RepID=A0ABV6A7H8_9PSEU